MRPELIMKSIVPVVMAGIIAIYGLVVAVLIAGGLIETLMTKIIDKEFFNTLKLCHLIHLIALM